ncbi:hypothetical protein [Enterobacter sp. UNJFSC 003]|uniref:hypothetical protein n=1 Tax=Enterobacter sp. UNJFSC 003 TaxID=3122077 RepID=UPI002E99987C|nr:hypothetical protein [Serratia liquefaciens]
MPHILYRSGVFVCLFVSITAIAKQNEWFLAQEEGAREYVVEDTLGNVLNFACETTFNASSPNLIGERILYLYIGSQAYDSNTQTITLSMENKSYHIGAGSIWGDGQWYAFWDGTQNKEANIVNVYVAGKKIAAFTMHRAAELYQQAPNDGCIKKIL